MTITGVTVDAVEDLGNDLERYEYNLDSDTLPTGMIDVTLVAGQVADLAGNVNAASSQSFTFQPPVILAPTANAQSVTSAENVAKAITLTGTDPNTPPLPLGFTVTAGPSHGTLSGNAPNLTYTPNTGYFGSDQFQFTTSNGTLTSAAATVSINVVGTPSATAQSVTTAQATAKPITLNGSDPNTPALPLTFSVTVQPSHGTLSDTAPNLVYTPTIDYFGTDSFRFTTGKRHRDQQPGHGVDHDRRATDGGRPVSHHRSRQPHHHHLVGHRSGHAAAAVDLQRGPSTPLTEPSAELRRISRTRPTPVSSASITCSSR